jgi:hypothetical protein
MIDIKVKTKNRGFTVPIPYPILNLCISVISSNLLTRLIDKSTKKYMNEKATTFTLLPEDKKLLKQMVLELKQHKGTELVYIKAKDGSEITITL